MESHDLPSDARPPAGSAFKKVLIVDDILYVAKSITKILKDAGYFTFTALSGREALEKCKAYAPDLVTVDQKLPDMSGLQLAQKILALPSATPPRIIFISSVYEREEIEQIMKQGIDDYLLKPFTKAKLIETVKRLI
jgi:two-component system, chemotaxis family, chemotaxis protein CheY